jgi:hypothetical protein
MGAGPPLHTSPHTHPTASEPVAPWGEIGVAPDHISDWTADVLDFTHEEAAAWMAAGILCGATALNWRRCGFSPDDAAAWLALVPSSRDPWAWVDGGQGEVDERPLARHHSPVIPVGSARVSTASRTARECGRSSCSGRFRWVRSPRSTSVIASRPNRS